jgi:aspartate aminotransferase
MKERGVLVNGLSKAFAMTGWRVGYTAAPKQFTEPMSRLQSHSTSGIATFVMPAAAAALRSDQSDVAKMLAAFEARRDLIVRRARSIPLLECTEPEGAFYLMARLPVADAEDFCRFLLQSFTWNGQTVMLTPGAGFYSTPDKGRDEVRIAYVLERGILAQSVDIIARALEAYAPA